MESKIIFITKEKTGQSYFLEFKKSGIPSVLLAELYGDTNPNSKGKPDGKNAYKRGNITNDKWDLTPCVSVNYFPWDTNYEQFANYANLISRKARSN